MTFSLKNLARVNNPSMNFQSRIQKNIKHFSRYDIGHKAEYFKTENFESSV